MARTLKGKTLGVMCDPDLIPWQDPSGGDQASVLPTLEREASCRSHSGFMSVGLLV